MFSFKGCKYLRINCFWENTLRYHLEDINKILDSFAPGYKKEDGMTSEKICFIINSLAKFIDQDECYFEVGCFKGATLLAAAITGVKTYACDNFSMECPKGFQRGAKTIAKLEEEMVKLTAPRRNLTVEESMRIRTIQNQIAQIEALDNKDKNYPKSRLIQNIKPYKNVTFYDMDFRKVKLTFLPRIKLYLYDGAHDAQSQFEGIMFVMPQLSDNCCILVDDWNWEDTRKGTLQALEVAQKTYRCQLIEKRSPRLNDPYPQGFWNGLAVVLLDKEK